MVQESHGMHHFHKRKRVHKKLEKIPHPNKWKRFLDKAIYVVGIIGPIMTVPQIYKIFVEKNAAGISLTSWVSYLVVAFFWLAYGISHKEKPIIVTNSLWIILEILVIVGTILYG